ncbi:hypothetical protein BWI93_17895 [Siphonobacter sp. BAB-5385]|uniref:hypothetical protein n=1 Tax=Siphonobacter sp. BAB-5385 TaxID=1864822 RepID=UPI000B9E8077|nr:hypothetical protein [Siphonobacter sp. BAB-5385]OZI06867.1 hypothetical protein BWI93_17895 [Siphonobacter sp. BAB-5385]
MIKFTFYVLLLFFVTAFSGKTYAQDPSRVRPSRDGFWLSLAGGGAVGQTKLANLTGAVAYEFKNKPTLLTLRCSYNLGIFEKESVTPLIDVADVGLLYGYKVGKFRFSAGVGAVWGTDRGAYKYYLSDPLTYGNNVYESLDYTTIGLPTEIRFITGGKDLGIGLTAFGNVNAKRSFFGLNLAFYLGELK